MYAAGTEPGTEIVPAGKEGGVTVKNRSPHNDQLSWRAELVIVSESLRPDDDLADIEQPSSMAALTIQKEPLPAWEVCGGPCPVR
jgi:hypothetical protein